MKKFCFLFVFVILSISAFAQNNKKGDFGLEIYFKPWNNGGSTFSLIDGIKGRFFINDKLAIRSTLYFDMNSDTNFEYDLNDVEYKTKSNVFEFGITPGIEYHFANYNKISFYVGGEFGVGFITASYKETNSDNDDYLEIKGMAGATSGSPSSGMTLTANVFTGVDYHFTNNLYIGAELGLGYDFFKSKEITVKYKTGGTATENKIKDYDVRNDISFYCSPAIRIGWTF